MSGPEKDFGCGQDVVDLWSTSSEEDNKKTSKRNSMEGKRKRTAVIDICDSSSDEKDQDQKATASKGILSSSSASLRRKAVAPKPTYKKRKYKKRAKKVPADNQTNSLDKEDEASKKMSFNIATYNIWFGPPHPKERMLALSQCLLEMNTRQNPLWFIGFQEVTRELGNTLFPILESAGYKIVSQDVDRSGYGCAIAIMQKETHSENDPKHEEASPSNGGYPKLLETGWVAFDTTIMNRGFVFVRAQLPNSDSQIVFTTTHLESFIGKKEGRGTEYSGSPERQRQIVQMDRFCQLQFKSHPKVSMAILSGDLNWDDERQRSQGLDQRMLSILPSEDWRDTWIEYDKAAPLSAEAKAKKKKIPRGGYTYDSNVNPMLPTGRLRRRFDRCLLRTPMTSFRCHVSDVEMIGKEAIPGLSWRKDPNPYTGVVKEMPVTPSDHFGYVVTLDVREDI